MIMKDFKGRNYITSKPSFSQYGASTTVWFNDGSYMELEVGMAWCNRTDTVEIEAINTDYYDGDDDSELDTDGIDLVQMAIDIFEHYNTFGSVENEMAKSYIADHE